MNARVWLAHWFRPIPISSRRLRRQRCTRLWAEQLEPRCVPALVTLANFNGHNGANALDGLILDSSGNLFGTTQSSLPSGAGTVYSYTVVTHPTHVAFADQVPYVVAVVELAEGPWLVTRITGCAPDEVRVGMAVRACFRQVADGITLPYFERS